MCSAVLTTLDLAKSIFEKDESNFFKLFKIFKDYHAQRALRWCIQEGWEKMVVFLIRNQNVSPHIGKDNVLCEAVRFGRYNMVKLLLRSGNYYDTCYFPDIIEAILLAEKKCMHEIALHLLYYLLDRTTEGVLQDEFNYAISEGLKMYSRNRDYIDCTRHIREINYFEPIQC